MHLAQTPYFELNIVVWDLGEHNANFSSWETEKYPNEAKDKNQLIPEPLVNCPASFWDCFTPATKCYADNTKISI